MKYSVLTTFLLSIISLQVKVHAQELFRPTNIRMAYEKGTRSKDGKPGLKYWQNKNDYSMAIDFNPETRLVKGQAVISYFNNSPDTLNKIVLRNYPDLYKKDALRDFYIAADDESDGVEFHNISIDGVAFTIDNKSVKRDGTLLTLKTVVMPGSTATLKLSWSYTLVKASSHLRTGEVETGAYFIAYFFPRIAVYDDLQGWDESQYLGYHEPYFEYGNYNVKITVPTGYVVWATGELKNAKEVLADAVYKRYDKSLTVDSAIYIITEDDLNGNNVTRNKNNTFQFEATDVPDFTFATSNKYIWMGGAITADRKTNRKTVINTVFNPGHKSYYEVNDFARQCIRLMNDSMPGIPYPYPHITIFDGLDQMEFPMMINDNPVEDRMESITLTVHEIFHTLFPFYVGANQTRYAWLDEGWATFSEWIISSMIDSTIQDDFSISYSIAGSGKEWDVPLIISSTEWKRSYRMNAYSKFALVLLYMKEMLGNEAFNKCMKDFITEWKSRHPSPWDFFNSVNTSSGKDFNWFWQKWFFDYGEVDPFIKSASVEGDSVVITISNLYKPVPLQINILYSDGSTRVLKYNAGIWKTKNEFILKTKKDSGIKEIYLRHAYVPDVNVTNNLFKF